MDTYDVAIVGGGPVGMALAVELGQRGVSCAVIERHAQPGRIPKGQNLTNRTLEHFYFWSCLDELRAARVMPREYPIGSVIAYRDLTSPYFHAGQEFSGRGAAVRDYYFQANERLPQYCTEAVLRTRASQLPCVTTRFGWTATRVDQDANGAGVTLRSTAGDERTLRARYLVGCDGGRSLVRERMGIDRGGHDFDQRMVLVVFRSKELHAFLQRFPPSTTYRVLKPELEGYWQFFGRIDVGEGFFFHAPVPRTATLEDFDVPRLLHEAAGFEFHAELEHVGFWDLRIMLASQYRLDRMFIAGDACHQHPPYGGFGLNTGLEDAVNLGWKLASVLHGWGGERLLDSYEQERRPIFKETADVMIVGGIEADRAWLERYTPERDLAEFERAWTDYRRTQILQPPTYEPYYEGSPVVAGPPEGVCSIHGRLSRRAEAGHHLAPCELSSGRNVFEELGSDFTLLAFDADDDSVQALTLAAQALHVPLNTIRDSFSGGRQHYGARLVLVRPDQYVAWAADTPPSDPHALLNRVSGQC